MYVVLQPLWRLQNFAEELVPLRELHRLVPGNYPRIEKLPEFAPVLPPKRAVREETEVQILTRAERMQISRAHSTVVTPRLVFTHSFVTGFEGRSEEFAERLSRNSWASSAFPITSSPWPNTRKYMRSPAR